MLKKLNQRGVVHWTTIAPLLVIVVIGAIGYKVLTSSHADSLTTTASTAAATTSTGPKQALFYTASSAQPATGVSVIPSIVNDLGSQSVVEMQSGSKLTFAESNTVAGSTSCYYVKALAVKGEVTPTVKAQFTSVSNTSTRNLTYDATQTSYSQICVGPGTAAHPTFNIANLSTKGPDLLVYQEIMSWSQP